MNETVPYFLKPKTVEQVTGLSGSTIWRLRRAGEFPNPVPISKGRVGFIRDEIDTWLRERAGAKAAA